MSASFKQLYVVVDCEEDRVILHKPLKRWGYGTYLFLPTGERYDCVSKTDQNLEQSCLITLSECAKFIRDDEDSNFGIYERSIVVKQFNELPKIVCGSVISVTSDWYDDEHNVRAEYFRGFYNKKIERTLKYFKVKDYQLPDPTKIDIYGFPKTGNSMIEMQKFIK